MSPRPKIKAVIFDIGGVVLGSPIVGVQNAERQFGLPSHYLNCLITAHGAGGAFQRLERNEIALGHRFYDEFGRDMSNVETGNAAYRRYCEKNNISCPALPTRLRIDGEELWSIMMGPAIEPSPEIIGAINKLRASRKYHLAALTNNFSAGDPLPSSSPMAKPPPNLSITPAEIRASLADLTEDPVRRGSPSELLKSMFDIFVESSVENLRKPDPAFYRIPLEKLGIRAEEAVFLDDIGHNLVTARKLGLNTIRVSPGREIEAVRELEDLLGLSLTEEGPSKL